MTSRAEAAYVYGPVPSRRLGQSLGVDPIPLKTCNYNCVYCQLGRTRPVTNERRDYIQPSLILAQLREALAAHPLGSIDYVTFVGQGEPTLCASLGRLIRQVKEVVTVPVAVITNGALMLDPQVRDELSAADAVLAIIRRHPMREVELLEALQRHDAQRVQDVLDALEASGQIRRRAYRDEVFVEHAGARFAEPGKTR